MSNWKSFSRAALGIFAERLHGANTIRNNDKATVWAIYKEVLEDCADKHLNMLDAWDINLQSRRYGDEITALHWDATAKELAINEYLHILSGAKVCPGTYTDDRIAGAVDILKAIGVTEDDVKAFRAGGYLYD